MSDAMNAVIGDGAHRLPIGASAQAAVRTTFEFELLNGFQRGFPLMERPYAEIARRVGATEGEVLAAYAALAANGSVSRIGAVFRPGAVGASALAAMRVPAARLGAIAALVSAYPEVSHNYERTHALNLWFVAAADDRPALARLFASIESATGIEVLPLPLVEEYHVDLGFDLDPTRAASRRVATAPVRPAAILLDDRERRLVAAMQEGLPAVTRPYARLALRAGMTEREAIEIIGRWCGQGVIRRWGVVVRHHELGYRANAMAVWDVPDASVAAAGLRLARESRVTLAYRRARHRPQWDYNLYCMIHGRERREVERTAAALACAAGLESRPHALLFSLRRFKQTGARSMGTGTCLASGRIPVEENAWTRSTA